MTTIKILGETLDLYSLAIGFFLMVILVIVFLLLKKRKDKNTTKIVNPKIREARESLRRVYDVYDKKLLETIKEIDGFLEKLEIQNA